MPADSPRRTRVCTVVVLLSFALALCEGCAYMSMWSRKSAQRRELARQPSLELSREYAPDSCFTLGGLIDFGGAAARPVLLAAVAREPGPGGADGPPQLVTTRSWRPLAARYALLLPQGRYSLYVFEDLDGDGTIRSGEAVGRGDECEVGAATARDGFVVDGPLLRVDRARPFEAPVPLAQPATARESLVDSLDDPLFDPALGELGLYDPARFLARTQSYFFGLEPFDPARTQVVFVHGAEGTPRDFKALAASLDRARFQPWFFYYPSGMPLEKMGAGLATALRATGVALPAEGTRLVLVAHSMGGLVARSALGKLCADGKRPPWLAAYVSFAAAYGGNNAAATGARRAPVVVPSWKDLGTGSPFLQHVFEPVLPQDLPFLLFFGWGLPGKEGPEGAGDGVIALRSQLDPRAQQEAWRTYGFPQSHTGILEEPEALRLFNAWLDRYASSVTPAPPSRP